MKGLTLVLAFLFLSCTKESVMAESEGSLKLGDPAPLFILKDEKGTSVSLESLRGKKVLLYFYPKADTPGCTRQACSIRDSMHDLKKRGVVVLGISPDPVSAQSRFSEKYHLTFPLLSDPDRKVAQLYGVLRERNLYGKGSLGILRSSFLINEEGKISALWYGIKPEDTVPKALKALDTSQP
jgi:peroxiredoxin Q/BCP